jgi:hypothetical protein
MSAAAQNAVTVTTEPDIVSVSQGMDAGAGERQKFIDRRVAFVVVA